MDDRAFGYDGGASPMLLDHASVVRGTPKMNRLPPLDVRIPPWNLDDLVARACPYCGTVENQPHCVRPDGLTVRECRLCSAFFISPAPTEAQLSSFYANYDKAHRLEAPATPAELLSLYRDQGPLYDFRVRELSSMMAFENKRVLDVGFGRAHFMWCLQSLGADVHGIELDDAAIAIARQLGLTSVRNATIDECADDAPYDLIVLNDVVEHPLAPMKLLHACAKLLAPGGVLLIWTPNGGAARGAEAPVTFRVDLEHMQYLTPEACSMMSGVLGLQISHFETYGFPSLSNLEGALQQSGGSTRVRRAARAVPGLAKAVRKFRTWKSQWTSPDGRLGAYHLFCIYQKPQGATERRLADAESQGGALQPGGSKG